MSAHSRSALSEKKSDFKVGFCAMGHTDNFLMLNLVDSLFSELLDYCWTVSLYTLYNLKSNAVMAL